MFLKVNVTLRASNENYKGQRRHKYISPEPTFQLSPFSYFLWFLKIMQAYIFHCHAGVPDLGEDSHSNNTSREINFYYMLPLETKYIYIYFLIWKLFTENISKRQSLQRYSGFRNTENTCSRAHVIIIFNERTIFTKSVAIVQLLLIP